MSTADDVRRLLLALGSAYEAQAIASLEDASTEQQQVPFEPDSHHPALANHAAGIRSAMATGVHTVRYAVYPSTGPWFQEDETVHTRTKNLEVRRRWGRAPYVGLPYVYLWDVAVDDLGRWVAGSTRVEYLRDSEDA